MYFQDPGEHNLAPISDSHDNEGTLFLFNITCTAPKYITIGKTIFCHPLILYVLIIFTACIFFCSSTTTRSPGDSVFGNAGAVERGRGRGGDRLCGALLGLQGGARRGARAARCQQPRSRYVKLSRVYCYCIGSIYTKSVRLELQILFDLLNDIYTDFVRLCA